MRHAGTGTDTAAGTARASVQSIWLCYAHLSPIQTLPEPAGSSFEIGGQLPLKKPELQQVNKEKLKGQIFVADTFLFLFLC